MRNVTPQCALRYISRLRKIKAVYDRHNLTDLADLIDREIKQIALGYNSEAIYT